MKIRYGFVTNSSSSSFILAFKDDEDYKEFVEWCDDFYPETKELFSHFMEMDKRPLEEQKAKTIEFIEFVDTVDDLNDWLDKRVDQKLSYNEKFEKKEELRKTQEYIDYRNELLKNEDIQKKIQRVKEAFKLCQGMVWDSNGGLIEWAIRNGFLQREFYEWTIIVNNVG